MWSSVSAQVCVLVASSQVIVLYKFREGIETPLIAWQFSLRTAAGYYKQYFQEKKMWESVQSKKKQTASQTRYEFGFGCADRS